MKILKEWKHKIEVIKKPLKFIMVYIFNSLRAVKDPKERDAL